MGHIQVYETVVVWVPLLLKNNIIPKSVTLKV